MTTPAAGRPRDWLTEINTDDMLAAWGLTRQQRWRPLRWLCRPAARWLADQVLTCDAYAVAHGLPAGAGWLLRRHARRVLVAGQASVPRAGPLLIAANHPGMVDALALFASVPRADLRIIAADRPFLQALPRVRQALLFLPEQPGARLGVVRAATAHLRQGGALLTFPGGEIEPDPALHADAVAALAGWSDSIGLLARAVPATRIVPAIVSGVLAPAAQRHPLTRLRRDRADRERFGAMLQIVVPAYRRVEVRVAFGPPLLAADLLTDGADQRAVTSAIRDAAARLIAAPPACWQPVVGGGRPPVVVTARRV
ncbi:MAG: 1-acyl-sn-glycerol-3-phosphate acyltransferase [Chloroflexi bacterium]|nr:1-acyl-sn-glycerol-3-phosphate acyltransferase [Chloroflexota bacterium]